VVTSSFKPDPEKNDPQRHSWAQDSSKTYAWILEQLDRYWALTLAHTSSRTIPQHLSDVIAQRLKKLAQLSAEHLKASDEEGSSSPTNSGEKHSTLLNAITIAERSWTHPVIVEILSGKCTDKSQCEPQVVQQVTLRKETNETHNFATRKTTQRKTNFSQRCRSPGALFFHKKGKEVPNLSCLRRRVSTFWRERRSGSRHITTRSFTGT
jgi:hypothetical protein